MYQSPARLPLALQRIGALLATTHSDPLLDADGLPTPKRLGLFNAVPRS